jgi:hypothetical protein
VRHPPSDPDDGQVVHLRGHHHGELVHDPREGFVRARAKRARRICSARTKRTARPSRLRLKRVAEGRALRRRCSSAAGAGDGGALARVARACARPHMPRSSHKCSRAQVLARTSARVARACARPHMPRGLEGAN